MKRESNTMGGGFLWAGVWSARLIFWIILAGLLMAGALAVLPLGAIGMALAIGVIAWGVRRVRRRRADAVLVYIDQAVRMNLPLGATVMAAAYGERSTLRKRLVHLGEALQDGAGLDEALRLAVPEMPERVVCGIEAAQRLGRLPQALARLVGRVDLETRQIRRNVDIPISTLYMAYPLVLGLCGYFICASVMPKFYSILAKFKVPIPWATDMLYHAYKIIDSPTGSIVAGIILIGPIALTMDRLIPPGRMSIASGSWVAGWVAWWIPVWRGLIRDRGMADLCVTIADAVAAGRTLDETLVQAAAGQSNVVMQYRVRTWADGVRAGVATAEAARRARLPRLLCAMLATTHSDEDLVQVMTFLARHYEWRVTRLRRLIDGLALPACVLTAGAFTVFIALALFLPITRLAMGVADLVQRW